MTATTTKKVRETKIAKVAARKRFERYGREEELITRIPDVKEDKVLEELKTIWRNWRYDDNITSIDDYYKYVRVTVCSVHPSAEDIEKFTIALGGFSDDVNFSHKAGMFLSVWINNGNDTDYVIHTKHLQTIDYIGYKNRKNIRVNGDVGYHVGWSMESGSIIIDGDTGDETGIDMVGGSITINGNAGNAVGHWMKDGEIHLEGDYKSISDGIKGGKIYHKGKLIREEMPKQE